MLRTLLLSLGITSVASAAVIPVAGITGQVPTLVVFTAATAIYGAIAAAAHRWLPKQADSSTLARLSLVAGCWIVVALSASAVTWIAVTTADQSAGAPALTDLWSAVFETVSGFSTTGLTMLSDSSAAEPWLQWWRSVIQWFGAIGVVVFAVTAAEPSGDKDTLIGSEWENQPGSHAAEIARRLAYILTGITAVGIAGQVIAGEPLWRALNHGLTAASTGGFVITKNSAADASGAARLVIALTLFVSALSFGTIFDRATRQGVPLWKRTQIRYGLGITIICATTAVTVASGPSTWDVIFNSVSASTTGGFYTGTSYRTVEALTAITMVSMFTGGAAGSTAGGIKSARVGWLAKAVTRWLPGKDQLEDDRNYLWDGDHIAPDKAHPRILGAASLVVTWLAIIAAATLILSVHNPTRPVDDMLFDAVSAASGGGLSSGVATAQADATTKATLTALMLAGRVEMTAFVVLILSPYLALRRNL